MSNRLINKKEVYNTFNEIHKMTKTLKLDCFNNCNGNCEDGALLLLPYENEYLSQQIGSKKLIFPSVDVGGIQCGFIAENEPNCVQLDTNNMFCKIHPLRPVDCLTYPVFPEFDTYKTFKSKNQIKFYLSKFCPLYKSINKTYINLSKKIWYFVLPYITESWMECYNKNVIKFFSQNDAINV